MGKINRRVMMIGGAITPPRIPSEWTWRQMAAEVFWLALKNTGIEVKDVDLVACNYNDRAIIDSSPGSQIAEALGILPKPVVPVANACAGNGIASYVAWNAIASGRCDVVVSMGFARSDNYDAMEAMNRGEIKRAMFLARASLFLNRCTNLLDGVSFVLERNPNRE